MLTRKKPRPRPGLLCSDSNPGFTVPLGYGGGLPDRHTGLIRFGFRDYDPDVGRWTAKDPIGYAGGDNDLYGYCLDDPINGVDPRGLAAVKPKDSIAWGPRLNQAPQQYAPQASGNEYKSYFRDKLTPQKYPSFSRDLEDTLKYPTIGRGRGPSIIQGRVENIGDSLWDHDELAKTKGYGISGDIAVAGKSADGGITYYTLPNGETALEFSVGLGEKSDLFSAGAQVEYSKSNVQNADQLSGTSEEAGGDLDLGNVNIGFHEIHGNGYTGHKWTAGASAEMPIPTSAPFNIQHKNRYGYVIKNPGKQLAHQFTDGAAERMLKYRRLTDSSYGRYELGKTN